VIIIYENKYRLNIKDLLLIFTSNSIVMYQMRGFHLYFAALFWRDFFCFLRKIKLSVETILNNRLLVSTEKCRIVHL